MTKGAVSGGAFAAMSSVAASVAVHGTALVVMGLAPALVGRSAREEAIEVEIRTIRVQADSAPLPAPVEVVAVAPVRKRAPVRHAPAPPPPSGITPAAEGMACPIVAPPTPGPIVTLTPAPTMPKGIVPSGEGTGGSDAEDAMPAYLRDVRDRLARRLVLPAQAAREGREGTVVLRMLVDRDGTLREIVPVGDSDPILRSAALVAVRGAILPAPPHLPGSEPISIRVPLRFVLSD